MPRFDDPARCELTVCIKYEGGPLAPWQPDLNLFPQIFSGKERAHLISH
ncbi:MAG TPA: hypothetical protein VGI74_14075 [Streptosporangiaceae bacterium]